MTMFLTKKRTGRYMRPLLALCFLTRSSAMVKKREPWQRSTRKKSEKVGKSSSARSWEVGKSRKKLEKVGKSRKRDFRKLFHDFLWLFPTFPDFFRFFPTFSDFFRSCHNGLKYYPASNMTLNYKMCINPFKMPLFFRLFPTFYDFLRLFATLPIFGERYDDFHVKRLHVRVVARSLRRSIFPNVRARNQRPNAHEPRSSECDNSTRAMAQASQVFQVVSQHSLARRKIKMAIFPAVCEGAERQRWPLKHQEPSSQSSRRDAWKTRTCSIYYLKFQKIGIRKN